MTTFAAPSSPTPSAATRPAVRRAGRAALLAAALGAAVLAVPARADKILSVGDSITQGTAGQCSYRRALTQILANTPGCDASFVGSQLADYRNTAACRTDRTPHFGFSGRKADWFARESRYANELAAQAPDRVLLHVGTNDVRDAGSQGVASTVQDIDGLLTETFDRRPDATVYLANVIPWDDARAGTSGVGEGVRRLGDALATLAADRAAAGDDVVLVDVRSGFDAATMTVDGVHPDPVGERHIADRFIAALAADGVCESFAAPTKALENRRWYQLGMPARGLDGPLTVRDVFADDLGADRFGTANPDGDWTLYAYEADPAGGAPAYREATLSTPLVPGRGYWFLHARGDAVTVDLPALAVPTVLTPETACASPSGCRAVALRADASASVAWNLVANPFVQRPRFGDTRADTDGGECAGGCTPDEALDARVIGDLLFRYDGAPQYTRVGPNDRLEAWDGAWLGALSAADGRAPRWVVPAD